MEVALWYRTRICVKRLLVFEEEEVEEERSMSVGIDLGDRGGVRMEGVVI